MPGGGAPKRRYPASMAEGPDQPVEMLRERCGARGLDLVHAFRVSWYNDSVEDPRQRLPDLGRSDALGVVIGNSQKLWPIFRRALDADPKLRACADPVDNYVTQAVGEAVGELSLHNEVRWAHALEPAPLPIQRVAHAAGLAQLAPSHLSVHPEHGPWIALRAVVVMDAQGPEGPPQPAPDPCAGCDKPCLGALQRAIAATGAAEQRAPLEQFWGAWLAVRDACPIGTSSRYDDEQIEYHYTKARRLLGLA